MDVFWKPDFEIDISTIRTKTISLSKQSLNSFSTQHELLKEYFTEINLSKKDWELLDEWTKRYLSKIGKNQLSNSKNWTLNQLNFSNTFGYGENNSINFKKLNGTTGIIGKNRIGKSSILGTLMYVLFDGTDRGSLKNSQIINRKKSKCEGTAYFSVGGGNYRIKRMTENVKKKNISSISSVSFQKIDKYGNTLQDFDDVLKNKVETEIKKLIGDKEDFLKTNLARQNELTEFIELKSTKRKLYINKFLGLTIFEEMFNFAKEDADVIKASMKSMKEKSWFSLVENIETEIEENDKQIENHKRIIESSRKRVQDIQIELSKNKISKNDDITENDINRQDELTISLNSNIQTKTAILNEILKKIENTEKIIENVKNIKNKYPIQKIKDDYFEQTETENSLEKLKNKYELEKTIFEQQEKSVQKLNTIPCGDSFPKCRFIKDSFIDKAKINNQKIKVEQFIETIESIQKNLDNILKNNLKEKLEKYEKLIQKENELKIEVSRKRIKIVETESEIEKTKEIFKEAKNISIKMKSSFENNNDEKTKETLKELEDLEETIKYRENANRICWNESGRMGQEIHNLKKEQENYLKIKEKWRLYELYLNAMGKTGISLQILNNQIPAINKEIANLLSGLVPFTIELEADLKSNSLDILIDDGETKGEIETACGAEKIFASIIIRAVLVKLSTEIPVCDTFFLDESLDGIDEENLDESRKLFDALKKIFKNVIIITHKRSLSSSVDNLLEIKKENGFGKINE